MKLKEFTSWLDTAVPLAFQESYDNCGLQTGDPEAEVNSVLLALECTEEVLSEASEKGSNLIVTHHPLIFSGLKQISGKNPTERIVMRAIREGIAIYSAHTNLDIISGGVSSVMARKLGLKDVKVLQPLKDKLLKLVTFIPQSHTEQVRKALFEAGAGVIGNYDMCGFITEGTGSYRGGADSNPFAGEPGKLHFEKEERFETILYSHLKNRVIKALLQSHPYEEVAYDLYKLDNHSDNAGLGAIGLLTEEMNEKSFLAHLQNTFGTGCIKHNILSGRKIRKVALCGGSGSGLLSDAIAAGADAFVTGDIKYHTFFDAGNKILFADIGHYESEKYSVEILFDLIIKKFPKFAVRFSEINTNPINYYTDGEK